MRIHHLNAGSMCPHSARLVNGQGGLFQRARLVCHVLLLETEEGLTLVDAGLGTQDIATPRRLGRPWLMHAAPRLSVDETAVAQVRKLGFSPDDVRHIVLTHLHLDHAGGIMDFPKATVHIHAGEHSAAVKSRRAKAGYVPSQWSDATSWSCHSAFGEDWFGFKGVRALNGNPDVLMIPLTGHTPGHCGVAVRTKDGWLLHAGDSYFFHGQIETPPVSPPFGLGFFQRIADSNSARRIANQQRLQALNCSQGTAVTIFCSHDPFEFDKLQARQKIAAP